jgi:hypothetical protein
MSTLREMVERLQKIQNDKKELLRAERAIANEIVDNLPDSVVAALRDGIVRLNFQAPRGFYNSIRNNDAIENLRRMVR